MAEKLGVPLRLVSQILGLLMEANLIAEVADSDCTYLPARPLRKITPYDVLNALRVGHGQELATTPDPMREVVREEVTHIEQAELNAASGLTFEELAERARRAVTGAA
jgi:DNA-binding IscR family transcriptional regulator